MTRFFTGAGDKGESVLGKIILPKDDPVFEALGSLDELNTVIGLCRTKASKKFKKISDLLKQIQQVLFIIQAETAAMRLKYPLVKKVSGSDMVFLEKIIFDINKKVPEITKFIIPGGSELSAHLEVARTVARRAERTTAKFKNKLNPESLRYLNRISSILFALARFVNFKLKIKEENPSY